MSTAKKVIPDRPPSFESKVAAVNPEPPWHDKIPRGKQPTSSKGWHMRTHGIITLSMVRKSDGQAVLPHIKCREYLQDVLGAKYLGFTDRAYSYEANPELIKDQELALVVGVLWPEKFLPLVQWGMAEGIKTFQALTRNAFAEPIVTLLDGDFRASPWHDKETEPAGKMIVVEYDQRIENHPAMFSLFVACLRSGASFPGTGDCARDALFYNQQTTGCGSLDKEDGARLRYFMEEKRGMLPLLIDNCINKPVDEVYKNLRSRGLGGNNAMHTGSGVVDLRLEYLKV